MKLMLALLVALLLSTTLAADTLLKVQWDQNPIADGVVSYALIVDGGPPMTVPNVLSPACSCIEVQKAFATGAHTLSLTALAPLLSTDPTVGGPSSSAVVTFTLNPGSQVKFLKVTK